MVQRESGQALIEYVILVALISLVVTGFVVVIGDDTGGILDYTGEVIGGGPIDGGPVDGGGGLDVDGPTYSDLGDELISSIDYENDDRGDDSGLRWDDKGGYSGYKPGGEDDPLNKKYLLDPGAFEYVGVLKSDYPLGGYFDPESSYYHDIRYIGEYPRNSNGDIVFIVPDEVTCINTGDKVYKMDSLVHTFLGTENSKDSLSNAESGNVVIGTQSHIRYIQKPFDERLDLVNMDLTRIRGENVREANLVANVSAESVYLPALGNISFPVSGNLLSHSEWNKIENLKLPYDIHLLTDSSHLWSGYLGCMDVGELESVGGRVVLGPTIYNREQGVAGTTNYLIKESNIDKLDFKGTFKLSDPGVAMGYDCFRGMTSKSTLDLTDFDFNLYVDPLTYNDSLLVPNYAMHTKLHTNFYRIEVPEIKLPPSSTKKVKYRLRVGSNKWEHHEGLNSLEIIRLYGGDYSYTGRVPLSDDVKLTVVE